MIESIFLDILLILVVLLMMAIGAYRGGLREAFSAAGVVLGAQLATEWSGSWGDWLARNTSASEGGARFAVSVALLVVATAAVGYGVGTSFNYHPGPGGRMFGVVLGAGSALIAIAYTLTWLRNDLFDGDEPSVLQDTYLARFLDGDAGFVLLLVSGLIVVGAIFGSLVRERDDDQVEVAHAGSGDGASRVRGRSGSLESEKVEPSYEEVHPSAPVRVQPARQWEDRAGSMPPRLDRQWSNTWPSDAPGIPQEERTERSGQVQQARERRRNQRGNDETPTTGRS